MRSNRLWPLTIGVLGLLLALASASSAQAAAFVSSNPAAGALVTTAPTQVTITADGALVEMGTSIVVTDPAGVRVDDGSETVSGATALVGIKPLTKTGLYTVTYQLIFGAGQNLNNSYTFTFNGPITATPTPTSIETLPPSVHSTFLGRLKSGGIGLLLVALILIVIGSRVAGSRRNRQ